METVARASVRPIFPPGMRLICDASEWISGSDFEITRENSGGKESQKEPRRAARTIKGAPGSLAEQPIWKP